MNVESIRVGLRVRSRWDGEEGVIDEAYAKTMRVTVFDAQKNPVKTTYEDPLDWEIVPSGH